MAAEAFDDVVGLPEDFFVDTSYEEVEFEFNGVKQRLKTLTSGATDYDMTADLIEGRSVLELGAGGGLPGLLCSRLGASRVVQTDGIDRVIKLLRDNASAYAGPACPDVQVAKLHWNNREDEDAALALNDGAQYDTVIAADCVFFFDGPETISSLFLSARRLLGGSKRGEDGRFVVTFVRRSEAITRAVDVAAELAHFRARPKPIVDWAPETMRADIPDLPEVIVFECIAVEEPAAV